MRGRRNGEGLFHWDVARGLWFRQVTHDVKLTNLQNLPPRPEKRLKSQIQRLNSGSIGKENEPQGLPKPNQRLGGKRCGQR
jgi:hypothetical protein